MKRFAWWENIILLSVLTLVLAGPIWGDGAPDSGPQVFTDYGSFLGEYQAAGAFKFYDNTEAILRLAQFEHALMRYRFLKGQIQLKGDYYGLTAMVDLRLKFLKKQMHLTERDIAAIPPRKARIPRAKPPAATPAAKKDAAAKPKPPGAAANKNNAQAGPSIPGQPPLVLGIPRPPQRAGTPPVTATPRSSGVPKVTTAPTVTASPTVATTPPAAAAPVPAPAATHKAPDVVTTDSSPAKEEKAEEVTKPAVPLSFWDRLKIRLHLKKQAADSGS